MVWRSPHKVCDSARLHLISCGGVAFYGQKLFLLCIYIMREMRMSDKKSEKDLSVHGSPFKAQSNLGKPDINDPLVRLMQENAGHRECLDNIKKLLRCNFTKDTEGLNPESAVSLVLKEHDKALEFIAHVKVQVLDVQRLLANKQTDAAMDLCSKILKNKI